MDLLNVGAFSFLSPLFVQEGLECAVCLCRYEDNEILRLLPKCKHAFHVDCVDLWLASHSTCPLCRHCVSSEDLTLVEDSVASRHSVEAVQQELATAAAPPSTSPLCQSLSLDELDNPAQVKKTPTQFSLVLLCIDILLNFSKS
jgi:hypothetical protein